MRVSNSVSVVFASVAIAICTAPNTSYAQDEDTSLPPEAISAIVANMAHSRCPSDCVIETGGATYIVNRVDLNGDGRPEYVVEDQSSPCGSAGCPTSLIGAQTGRWLDLLDFLGGSRAISLLASQSAGYRDISLRGGTPGTGIHAHIFRWDGNQYRPSTSPKRRHK